jgi:hypothetical protein
MVHSKIVPVVCLIYNKSLDINIAKLDIPQNVNTFVVPNNIMRVGTDDSVWGVTKYTETILSFFVGIRLKLFVRKCW